MLGTTVSHWRAWTRNSADAIAANLLQPYVESIFQLLNTVYQDPNRTEALLRSSMGVIGYVIEIVSLDDTWLTQAQ